MLIILALIFSLLVQNDLDYQLSLFTVRPPLRLPVSIYGYCIKPLIIYLFICIISEERKSRFFLLLIAANALLYLSGFFSAICVTYNTNNSFVRGPLGYCCHVVCAICLAHLFHLTFRRYRKVHGRDMLLPFFNLFIITVAVILDSRYYFPLLVSHHRRGLGLAVLRHLAAHAVCQRT